MCDALDFLLEVQMVRRAGSGIDGGGAQAFHRRQTSLGVKQSARRRKCPSCWRLGALQKPPVGPDGFRFVRCRYCGYERGGYVF